MISIERIEFYKINFPFIQTFSTSFGSWKEREIMLIKIIDTDGNFGIGESAALDGCFYKPESHKQVIITIKEVLFPLLIQNPVESVSDLNNKMALITGQYFAKSSISLAMYDLFAKKENKNICEFLNIKKRDLILSKTFSISTGGQPLIDQAQKAWDEGIRLFKLKIKPYFDYDATKALRESFPQAKIMCDGNAAYSFEQDILLARLKEFDLLCIEQPFSGFDLVYHAHFHKKSQIPLALDESIDHPVHLWQAQELQSATFFNIKIGRVGGLGNAIEMQSMKRSKDLFWVGGLLEGPIGLCANLALAQMPNFSLPVDFMDCLWLMPQVLEYFEQPLFNVVQDKITPSFFGTGLNGNINLDQLFDDSTFLDSISKS